MSDDQPAPRRDSQGRTVGRILVEEAALARRCDELARAIRRDLPDDEPVLVGLLTGSFVFVADLARSLSRCGVRPRIHLVRASHYQDGTEPTGDVRLSAAELELDVKGRSVLLVDDVLDSGHTLALARRLLAERRPAWLRTCVLLEKPARRTTDVPLDHVGFRIPDVWVVGYGLDDADAFRELPFVAELRRGD